MRGASGKALPDGSLRETDHRRNIGNMLEIDSLEEVWKTSPVLSEVRDMAVGMSKKIAKHKDGAFFSGYCMGLAETQTGDPMEVYPQVELNARAVRRNYELLQIGGAKGNKSA